MTKWWRTRATGVFGVVIVLLIVGLVVRSCSPSRSVGRGAVEETCFNLWHAERASDSAAVHQAVDRAQDAASRSHDPVLVADVSRVSEAYAAPGSGGRLNGRDVQGVLAECKAQGWKATDSCTYGAAVCGPGAGDTRTTL